MRKAKGPPARLIKFANEYVKNQIEDGMPSTIAADEAVKISFDVTNKTPEQIRNLAKKTLHNHRVRAMVDEIQQTCRSQFIILAPDALDRLEWLAKHAESEKVKLQANIEILDRAGLKPPEKVEMATVGIFGAAPVDEIRELLRSSLEGNK